MTHPLPAQEEGKPLSSSARPNKEVGSQEAVHFLSTPPCKPQERRCGADLGDLSAGAKVPATTVQVSAVVHPGIL